MPFPTYDEVRNAIQADVGRVLSHIETWYAPLGSKDLSLRSAEDGTIETMVYLSDYEIADTPDDQPIEKVYSFRVQIVPIVHPRGMD